MRLRTHRHVCAKQGVKAAPPVSSPMSFMPGLPYRRSIFNAGTDTDLPGKPVRHEGEKPVKDRAVNKVYDNTGIALNFFHEVFGRDSLDDRSMRVESAVHFGKDFANAMWTGEQMVYGDGDHNVGGFTEALDIITHELSHGVLQHMIPGGLGVYRLPVKDREFREQTHALQGQAGALNESFSDVMGSMVKQWHAGQTAAQANWLLGENMLAPQHGKAIRSLKDPGNRKLTWYDDDQFKTMEEYVDGADVHDSSGIPNHAFYLTARKIGGFSWEKAGAIWYEAFPKLKPKASFLDAARATSRVASARYGSKSKEYKAVVLAWETVKVLT
ncbi:Thermolysin metallopeptidase, catalytic domain [Polaromonas sp. YR568]|uniref:M4 family metallopeptidase n=1 Tax=Polaromonas sp. YR568 TaxID=1855301 RepID=UPI0008EEC80E|nr:M4 family metallopeptidase [Polaromonas sp. YR568]SFU99842.1 Thermolysin metallopeptidase, catalytic domain [Polaromonas sp. YR568]